MEVSRKHETFVESPNLHECTKTGSILGPLFMETTPASPCQLLMQTGSFKQETFYINNGAVIRKHSHVSMTGLTRPMITLNPKPQSSCNSRSPTCAFPQKNAPTSYRIILGLKTFKQLMFVRPKVGGMLPR